MEKQKKKQNGITLIALVISIIVMLILAGVSINSVVGDNGIIGSAQKATKLQNIATLQEWFGQLYVDLTAQGYELSDSMDDTPLNLIMNAYDSSGKSYKEMFFKTSEGYCLKKVFPVTLEDGTETTQTYVFYLIRKENLPEEIKSQIRGSEQLESRDYRKFIDVYGITSDLKVYYCEKGLDSMLGLTLADINADSPDIIYANADSILAKVLNGGTSSITNQNLKSVSTLTIDTTEKLSILSDIGSLLNLKTVYFKNLTIPSLNGIQDGSNITYVDFENCTCQDYSALSGLSALTKLYLVKPSGLNTDVATLCSTDRGIANAQFSNLQYFGISGNRSIESSYDYGGNTNITDISPLANLSDTTKKAIKYLYLKDMKLTSISALRDFTNVYSLHIFTNQLTTFDGIQNMSNLTYLYARNNTLLGTYEGDTQNTSTDVLSYLYKEDNKNTKLYYLDLVNDTKVKWLSYLNECTNLKYLYLTGLTGINDISSTIDVIKNLNGYYIDSKYTLDIASGAKVLDFNNQTLTVSQFEDALKTNTTVKYLRLTKLKLKDDSGTELTRTTATSFDSEVNSVLKTCTGLVCVWLNETNLETIEFVKNTPDLKELMINNTYVTTNDGDATKNGLELLNTNCSSLGVMAIGSLDENVNIKYIQPAINKVSTNFSNYSRSTFETSGDSARGVIICKTKEMQQLAECTDLTIFRGYCGGWGYKISGTVDMTSCTNITKLDYGYGSFGIKCPSSVTYINMGASDMASWDLSTATELSELHIVITGGNATNMAKKLEELANKTKLKTAEFMINYSFDQTKFSLLKNSGLETLTLRPYSGQQVGYIKQLDGINEISTLKTLNCYGVGLTTLSGIGELSSLTTVNLSSNQLRDVNGIEECKYLTSITINNNQINDIYPISALNKLTYINLQNNALTDMSSHNGVGYETLDIFYDLNYQKKGALKSLYISGNNIDDTEILIDLNWSGKSGF